MKQIFTGAILISSVLLTGCAQRMIDFTLASTKNVNLNSGDFITGERTSATDTKAIFIFPIGIPSLKEASDKAIESDKCAVALSDVKADFEHFAFIAGYARYRVEGTLVIDKSKPGCETWPN